MRIGRGVAVAVVIALLMPVAASAAVGSSSRTQESQFSSVTSSVLDALWNRLGTWIERMTETMVALWSPTRGTIVPGGEEGAAGAGSGQETLETMRAGGW